MGAFPVPDELPTSFKEHHISEPRINDRIRVPEVRLVGPGGEQVGVVRIEVALSLAQDADLDLVEVAPDARPPVCKLMDYGKFKYESDMKAREARRNQANTVLKEIRFRLKIDPHDYGTKRGHVERFLAAGDKVKVMIMFRGREQSRPEMGVRLLQRLAEDVQELGFIESMPKQDGRNMIMVLGPTKKKAEAKNEQRRRAEEESPRAARPARVEEPADPSASEDFEAQVAAATEAVAAAPKAAPVQAPAPAQSPAAAAPAPAKAAPAAKPAAESKPAAAPKPAAAAKPAAAPKPAATPKPVAKPATPKPPAARPAAPRPSAKPAPQKSE
ncbi:translation initiation factor IF-3 [Sanguibacter inulinus]|uniref:Translation initiation factor IF-3 n=1 Tax=Sanguibacter inulinus TaxID=60922 RepID=A0A853ESR4_9MICO|nr:translation initiation factor IF-3 [Sanguibacter inulinus]MBF0722464.1 translation initiation factor IF-3 [Sanguibacter inulinus]NYS93609.1 translation initiation factor IF-3 [Sanguibacter inulinus]